MLYYNAGQGKAMELTKKLDWGKYVSPMSDRLTAPFNWYAFKHRFGSGLVANMFKEFGLKKGDTVFDPYCGGATTLIKAKLDGYNAVGLDLSPFPVFLANVLTRTFNPARLKKQLGNISHDVDNSVNIPDVGILDKSFTKQTLKYIYSLRNSINTLDTNARDFYLFSLLCILNDVSKAKKSGGFLRITDQEKIPKRIVKSMFIKKSEQLLEAIKLYRFTDASVKAVLGDARAYPDEVRQERYDAILTSPPYPNRHDYTRIYELELLVGFIDTHQSLKNLRYETLRSHVEAKKQFNAKGYRVSSLLESKIRGLRSEKLNNTQIISTLYGYFEDMYLCLKEMRAVLKPGKNIGLVVSNVRFAGIMIPVDKLLAEIGEQVGLNTEKIYVLRYRGNSSQQMLRHRREPARESLIIWRK